MKKIKKTLLYLFGFAALLLIITVVINLPVFDEELLPEVAAIKNIKAEPFSEDNAYPAFIAINGASDKSFAELTSEVRVFLNQKISQSGIDYLNGEELNTQLGKGHDKKWRNTFSSCVSRRDKNCMQKMVDLVQEKTIKNERLIEQFNRYERLLEYSEFNETTQFSFDSPLIPYGTLMNIKQVYISDKLINQPSEKFLSTAITDIRFWRMVLDNAHLMISDMVAVSSLNDSVNGLSVAIKQRRLNVSLMKKLQDSIKPLNQSEINLGRTFEFEFKSGISVFDNGLEGGFGGTLAEWLYQPQATHNVRYLHETKPLKKVVLLNSTDFYNYIKSDQKNKDFTSPVNWSPSMLYNPTGKRLVSYAIPAYTDYIARVHDLNGMFHLLKLQIEIALNTNQPVKQVVINSQYTNPYTLEPMGYNKDTHSIYFDCMDKTSVCELDL